MQELIEMVEDLRAIDTFGSDTTAFESILIKWEARLVDAEADMERQFEMFEKETF